MRSLLTQFDVSAYEHSLGNRVLLTNIGFTQFDVSAYERSLGNRVLLTNIGFTCLILVLAWLKY
jgi:hypothetical protein